VLFSEKLYRIAQRTRLRDGTLNLQMPLSFQDGTVEEKTMPQSTHNRVAELYNLAIHSHDAAAVAHGKGDHLIAHELSRQAVEHSVNALIRTGRAEWLAFGLGRKAGQP
jgi:hypothetical protein